MRTGYVDLDRTFLRYDVDADPERAAALSYFGQNAGLYHWSDLLAHGRTVILGEAGSGKTWEMEAQARRLKDEGKPAFFVRVDDLAHRDLACALDASDGEALSRWLRGGAEGVFLLDAKDEAQLADHHAFTRALAAFARNLGRQALSRAQIVISCRVSEWQPTTDLETVWRLLGPARTPPSASKENAEETEDATEKSREPPVRVVQLAVLDSERVRRLAARRLEGTEAFMRALDQAHAWEFARRPRDVENLLTYWQENGRLGSLHELIEYDVAHKLSETNDARLKGDPLDRDRARKGAEALAAAVTLTRRFTFPLPDPSVAFPVGCLDAKAVLSDWRDGEIRALLGRAVFDEAAYGKIRFHHRGSVDYLAARWFERLTRANYSQQALARLLFRESHGRTVVAPSLAPIVAWLSAWLPTVRCRLMEVDPDILLRHGDPSLIPLPQRELLLQRVAEQCRYRRGENLEQLQRLADPALAPIINRLLGDASVAEDVKEMLLLMVRLGRLDGCGEACLSLACDEPSGFNLRLYAVRALAAIGDEIHLRALATSLMNGGDIPGRLAAEACEALYPNVINEAELVQLLRKVEEMSEEAVLWLPRNLAETVEHILSDQRVPELVNVLLELSRTQPWVKREGERRPSKVSRRYRWVFEPLLMAVRRVLARPDLIGMSPEAVAAAISRLARMREFLRRGQSRDDSLQSPLSAHPAVRKALTAARLVRLRKAYEENRIWLAMLEGHWELWRLTDRDIPWLLEDARGAAELRDRRMAIKLAIDLWHGHGRPLRQKIAIMVVAVPRPELWAVYRGEMNNWVSRFIFRARRWIWRHLEDRPQFWWMRSRLRAKWEKIAVGSQAVLHIGRLWQGEDWRILYNLMALSAEAGKTTHRYEDKCPERIAKTYGRPIAWCARRGLKSFWRRWLPPLPEGDLSTSYYPGITALVGIKLDIEDGLDLASLPPEQVEIAARLSLHELNGFPSWLPDFASIHPTAVRDVFVRQIAAEFALHVDHPHPSGLISDLEWDEGGSIRALCAPDVLAALNNGEPANVSVLSQAIDVLIRSDNTDALPAFADRYGRAAAQAEDWPRFNLWLAIWFQVDADPALAFLEAHLAEWPARAGDTVIALAAALYPRGHDRPRVAAPSYAQVSVLLRLITILYRHIRPEDDLHHEGGYSPVARDHAQDFRWHAVGLLTQAPGQEAYDALMALADDPGQARSRDYLLQAAFERAKQDADGEPWSPEEVAAFAQRHERPCATADDLFSLLLGRFEDVIEDAEKGDFSLRGHFKRDDDESVLQKWLAGQLDAARRGAYEVVREPEVAFRKEPDIRIIRAGIDPVTIEAKWAHKWSFTELRHALEHQLIGQYMLTNRSRHGVFVLANLVAGRTWVPTGEPTLDFRALVRRLQEEAQAMVAARGPDEQVVVLGIDLT